VIKIKRVVVTAVCALSVFSGALMTPGAGFSGNAAVSPAGEVASIPLDDVAALAEALKAGAKPLTFSPTSLGYVPDLLQRLSIAEDSQVLVFSRTSLQQGSVSPASPRAIYFNDTVSVGYIPGARLIELWAVGRDGMVRFYTLDNQPAAGSAGLAEDETCRFCHAARNPAAPGPMMLSVSTQANGTVLSYGRQTDGRTPIAERWGGWYVTGGHGSMRHRGNVIAEAASPAAAGAGQNLSALDGRFNRAQYSRPTSDIVALLTLEHATGFLNYAGAIQALATVAYDPAQMDKVVEDLADYMLGVDTAVLSGSVTGVSGFSERFEAQGSRDGKGRSLREFDLQTRLFRYPLSYMIYTPAFDGLPPDAKTRLYRRLADVLSGRDRSPKYRSLPEADRVAAFDILAATKPGLPTFWQRDVSAAALP